MVGEEFEHRDIEISLFLNYTDQLTNTTRIGMGISSKSVIYLLMLLICISNCSNDDNDGPTPIEARTITTLRFTLQSPNSQVPTILSYQDLDGNGGMDPVITVDTLIANTVYFGNIEVFDESVSPAADITNLVKSEETEHQVFYIVGGGVDLKVNYADEDANRNPIGLFVAMITGDTGNGTLTINLQRGLNKFADGVPDGRIDNGGGRTDIQVTFPVIIGR